MVHLIEQHIMIWNKKFTLG